LRPGPDRRFVVENGEHRRPLGQGCRSPRVKPWAGFQAIRRPNGPAPRAARCRGGRKALPRVGPGRSDQLSRGGRRGPGRSKSGSRPNARKNGPGRRYRPDGLGRHVLGHGGVSRWLINCGAAQDEGDPFAPFRKISTGSRGQPHLHLAWRAKRWGTGGEGACCRNDLRASTFLGNRHQTSADEAIGPKQ